MWKRLRSPSGVQRGSRKQEIPPSAWARTRNASHIGAEQNHLWPVSSYSAPGPPAAIGTATVVFARTSEPPCFSVIAIPHRAPALSGAGAERAVVVEREEARLPGRGDVRLPAQRRDHRVGHRDRTTRAGLGLGEAHEGGRAGDVGSRLRLAPGQRMGAVGDVHLHQLVPRRVELDLVDPVAEAVVGAELGRVLVRHPAELDRRRPPGDLADGPDRVDRKVAALAGDGLDERPVRLEDVVVGERRRLVGHRVGRVGRVGWTVGDRHDSNRTPGPDRPSLTLPCSPR